MSQVKFRATIDKRKRIQVPSRLETFTAGSKVLVTLEDLPQNTTENTEIPT